MYDPYYFLMVLTVTQAMIGVALVAVSTGLYG